MQKEHVSLTSAWPHQWAQLRDVPGWAEADLSSFYYVDPKFLEGQKSVSTPWSDPIWSYGNTETFTIVTGYSSGTPYEITGDSHGEALPGASVKIVDPLTGETLPRGERGEIASKGATLMLGYVGVPIGDTLDDEGYFRTGDGGYIDERGRLFWEGRLNDIIKTGGANVSPVEVDAILDSIPGVRISRTAGVPHETLGEMVVAVIIPYEGATLDEETVKAYAKERLASYKVPRRVLFVSEEDLHLTGSAKVKMAVLRDLATRLLKEAGEPGVGTAS
jgi:acyl-CoA synthetase (AMP-forming)/AMP-acid ligase II